MTDVIIIGAGPIGLTCGIEAQKRGLSYKIIDKGVLVNSIYHYPLNMTFFSTSEKLEIGGVPFVSNNPKPTRSEALEYYRRVAEKFKLNINLYEETTGVVKKDEHFEVTTSKANYQARKVVIATGFYDLPNKMDVPGEDLPKVKHYYREPHPYIGQKVAVIGASNSAVDAALECYRKGAQVTMVVRGKEISDRVKYWVRPDILNRIEEGSVKAHFNSVVQEITEDAVIIEKDGQQQEIPNDFVLALTGYKPDYSMLQETGIELSADDVCSPIYNQRTMETNVRGLYLAGVICGGMETHKWFIENSRIHAEVIMKDVAGKEASASPGFGE